MVLGRLAIDQTRQNQGIGSALLRDAIFRTLQAAEIGGIRALIVHAIDEAAARFYGHRGFMLSPSDPGHSHDHIEGCSKGDRLIASCQQLKVRKSALSQIEIGRSRLPCPSCLGWCGDAKPFCRGTFLSDDNPYRLHFVVPVMPTTPGCPLIEMPMPVGLVLFDGSNFPRSIAVLSISDEFIIPLGQPSAGSLENFHIIDVVTDSFSAEIERERCLIAVDDTIGAKAASFGKEIFSPRACPAQSRWRGVVTVSMA